MIDLEQMANNIRIWSLKAIHTAGSGHPGGCLSCADILAALYGSVMQPKDKFILSKGHAAPALYAALAETGILEHNELLSLRKIGSRLQGHPHIACPGVETSTGSLGQGLSVAVGMAYGLKYVGSEAKVYVLIGDGELQEGICWEALMFAAHHDLGNLCVILDYNRYQSDNFCSAVLGIEIIYLKIRSFGFFDVNLPQGNDTHSIRQLIRNLDSLKRSSIPAFIIANTTKGKGVSFMEDKPEWHGSIKMTDEQLELALSELCS